VRVSLQAEPLLLHLHAHIGVHGAAGLLLPLRGRAAALAALVALQPGLRRQHAAQLLWPDTDDPRNNLRQQLARFRKVLGRPLLEGEHELVLAAGIALAEPADGTELLAGEEAGDDDFGRWLQQRRAHERLARSQPLQQALARAEAAGDLDTALDHAQQWLRLAPGDEAAHAALMRLHYLRGERPAGLAAWQRLQDELAQQGRRPAAASHELAQALARTAAATPGTAAVPLQALPVTLKRPPRLAGRSLELAAARAAWAAGHAVLLEGEAGMGKSRLIGELAPPQPGCLQAAGRPGDRGAPYTTLQRLLQPLHGAQAGGLPLLSPRPAAADSLRAGELEAAVRAHLAAHAVHTLVLDDLHFADDATLELLSGLAAADSPVQRWLFAQRPAEAASAATALRDGLLELQRLQLVTLAPLDGNAATELVDALAIEGLHGAAIADALVRHTGGNPLFLLETLKQGLADGSLARGELPRPSSVGALIDRRLLRLSEPALTLARVAAVAGVDFGIELAEAAIGVRAVQLASAWDELQTAQVLRDEAFAHDLVADAVLRGVPAVVARRLHAQCAAWLQERDGEPARLAWHWHHGGQPQRAAQCFELAAARAANAGRRAEEAALYQHAAARWAEAGQPDAAFEALASRVDALTRADFGPAALQEAQALQAHAHTDAQRLRAARSEIDLLANRGQAPQVVERASAALELARRLGSHDEQLAVSGPLAGCLTQLGRADEAQQVLMALQPWVDTQAQPLQKQVWLGYLSTALLDLGRLAEAVRLREQQLAIALELGVAPVAVMAYNHLGVAQATRGCPGPAVAAARQAVALCDAMPGDTTRHALARYTLARHLLDDARFGEALQILQDVLAHFEAAASRFWAASAALTLAALWLRLGQVARAQPLLQRDEAGLPPRLHALRRLLMLEQAQALGQAPSITLADEACAAMPGELGAALATRVAALRAAPAGQAFETGLVLARQVRRHERTGAEAAALVWHLRAATTLGRHDEACSAAAQVLRLLAQDHAPEAMYRGEAYQHAWKALAAAGREAEATAALHAGVAWVQQRALPQVPPEFVDGFLHRQQANRQLFLGLSRTA
jgi:DNA-binding SARP family transcriptional activator/predicted ATPase